MGWFSNIIKAVVIAIAVVYTAGAVAGMMGFGTTSAAGIFSSYSGIGSLLGVKGFLSLGAAWAEASLTQYALWGLKIFMTIYTLTAIVSPSVASGFVNGVGELVSIAGDLIVSVAEIGGRAIGGVVDGLLSGGLGTILLIGAGLYLYANSDSDNDSKPLESDSDS